LEYSDGAWTIYSYEEEDYSGAEFDDNVDPSLSDLINSTELEEIQEQINTLKNIQKITL
jgi:hypothetical protein